MPFFRHNSFGSTGQQTGDIVLPVGVFICFAKSATAWVMFLVIGGLSVGTDIAFEIAHDDVLGGHAEQVIRLDRHFTTTLWGIDDILRDGIA